jgi:hypothetical protein
MLTDNLPAKRGGARPPRSRNAFKVSEIVRASKAAAMANIDVASIDINPMTGVISLVVRGGQQESKAADLDLWVAKRGKDARPA